LYSSAPYSTPEYMYVYPLTSTTHDIPKARHVVVLLLLVEKEILYLHDRVHQRMICRLAFDEGW